MANNHEMQELERIEAFVSAYNEIEKHLSSDLGDRTESFSRLVKEFKRRHRYWNDDEDLYDLAKLRNLIVHNMTISSGYLGVPTTKSLERILQIRDRLTKPERAIPKYSRKVIALRHDDILEQALHHMFSNSFSQFPVYRGSEFLGLLTENGVVRWVATNCGRDGQHSYDAFIADVLKCEEDSRKVEFCSRYAKVDELVHTFATNPKLEAILITEHGRESESLLGIATRFDILAEKG